MPREFSRSDRVASEIKREMAELIRLRVKNSSLGMVTVSDAEVTRDLAVAKIYLTFLGNRLSVSECLKHMQTQTPELRRELGRRIRIRVLPEIRFVHDSSIENGIHMDALLDGLVKDAPPSDQVGE
jgi:ribosome-binding factor A